MPRQDEPKDDVISKAAEMASSRRGGTGGPPGDSAGQYVRQYYRHVALEDLAHRSEVDVYGAAMSRFGMAISNLSISGENQTAARGRILDADFAAETSNLSRAQILQQAGSAMVAQANQLPNTVLTLLR